MREITKRLPVREIDYIHLTSYILVVVLGNVRLEGGFNASAILEIHIISSPSQEVRNLLSVVIKLFIKKGHGEVNRLKLHLVELHPGDVSEVGCPHRVALRVNT